MTGAVLGKDFVLVSLEKDISSLFMTATITANDIVTVCLHNFTGGEIDLNDAAVAVRIKLLKNKGDFYATISPGSLADGATTSKSATYTGSFLQNIVLFSPGADTQDLCVSAQGIVNALLVSFANETGVNPLDIGSSTWSMRFLPYGQPLE